MKRRALSQTIAAQSNPEGAPAGGISAPVYGIITERFSPTKRVRSRTLYRRAPPKQPKNFPARQPPLSKPKKFADRNGGCRAGKFGEMREVWRGKRPLRKGSLPPPRSSSPLHEPLRRDEGVAEKHRDGHRSDAARDGRDEGAERGNRGEVHIAH